MNGEELNQGEKQGFPTQEEIKRMRKQAAVELAEYKKRLRESVELKRLQVEELELNIKFFELRGKHRQVEAAMAEEEAMEKAQMQKMQEEAKSKTKPKIEIPHVGSARTDEEIEAAKSL